MKLTPGSRLGPYEVLEVLGRGGMGVVYAAVDPRLERRIALKTLSEELSLDEEWKARFSREARLLASLNHPNIATIYSLERDGDIEYLTMELIPGRSLDEMIRSGAIAFPDALAICRQIARGVEAAHGAGVIHRDLKPQNVMITPESHVKLLDFGLATRASTPWANGPASDLTVTLEAPPIPTETDNATAVASITSSPAARSGAGGGSGSGSPRVSATTGAGTPGYMSPEQIRGEELDARTDLWAFGCVLYECLSGTRAFQGSTPQERMRSTLEASPDLGRLPSHTPEPIRELIRSCLQSSLNARSSTIASAREVLEDALSRRSWEPAIGPRDAAGGVGARSDVPSNLPSEVTHLVGRTREVEQIRGLLEQSRLVTLTGIGGGGKTRLAIRVGATSLERFPDGVWMVELAPVTEGAGVVRAVAKAMGIAESAGKSLTDTILAHCAGRSLLLILDNCEHVVEAAAELAAAMLGAGPRVKILTTSRETLGLSGESVFQVPPLEVPPLQVPPPQVSRPRVSTPQVSPLQVSQPQVSATEGASAASLSFEAVASMDSVQLFTQRAAQVRPDFRLGPENIQEVAEICRRLEGIPLAIELAAARTKALSLAEISRRLDDRFALLRGTSRTAMRHHQTLEALIDWSHSNLTESERRLFRRLALFRGGWTLEAAERVCAGSDLEEWEVLDVLTRLIEKSLVAFVPGGEPGSSRQEAPRYRMLETVREYAHGRLRNSGEAPSVEALFQSYFTNLAETAAQLLTGPAQSEWLGRLDAEVDNLRAAIARSLDGEDPVPALRITGQMLRYWMIRAQWREGRAALERAIAMPGAESDLGRFGTALNAIGSCCYQLNDLQAAARHYHRAVDGFFAAGERRRAGPPLLNLGNVYRLKGDLDQAAACLTRSLECFEESDQWMIASVQGNLGSVFLIREEYEEARAHYEAAIAIFKNLGDRVHIGLMTMNSALVAIRQERLPEARSLLEECAAIFDELGDRNIGANVQVNLGIVLLSMAAEAEARETFTRALRMVRETGNVESIAACLEGFSQLARLQKDVPRAVRLAGVADSIRTTHEVPRQPVDQRQWEAENEAYAREVGEETFARHFAEGQALDLDAAVALGLEGTDAGLSKP